MTARAMFKPPLWKFRQSKLALTWRSASAAIGDHDARLDQWAFIIIEWPRNATRRGGSARKAGSSGSMAGSRSSSPARTVLSRMPVCLSPQFSTSRNTQRQACSSVANGPGAVRGASSRAITRKSSSWLGRPSCRKFSFRRSA